MSILGVNLIMIKLSMDINGLELNNNGKKKVLSEKDAYKELKNLRIGSNLLIESDNIRVKKHSGDYYLLFLEEYEEVNILYTDKQGLLRLVFMGREDEALKGIYQNVADEMVIKILKSSNKKAYRVVEENHGNFSVIEVEYKNKSSQLNKKIYLTIQEAIKVASYNHRQNGGSYRVITPKGTVLFDIG